MQDNNWQDHFFGFGMNFSGMDEAPDKFSRHIGLLYDSVCPECGTKFSYPNVKDWAYKVKEDHGYTLLCRYNCMRRRQAKRDKALADSKAHMKAKRREREALKKQKQA